MRVAFVLGLTGLVALAGCPNVDSLTGTGVLEDTDRDGGNVSKADGGPASDAASADGASGDATRFCLRDTHSFCDDFDVEGAPLSANWSTMLDDDGLLATETLRFASPPRSLRAALPRRGNTNQVLFAQAVRRFQGPWKAIHFEADVHLERLSWQGGDFNAAILGVLFFDGDHEIKLGTYLFVGNGTAGFTLEGVGDGNAVGPFPEDRWTHVTVDLDPARSFEGLVGVGIDARRAAAEFSAVSGSSANASVELHLGLSSFNDPVPAFSVSYDNVTVDFR